ncbi:MAG: transglutaminase-like domain-containing protein [Nanoarchaeota archaeon]|nr:transglutaminase-like domain-containing protein [Nanoarchaeota archaeon]
MCRILKVGFVLFLINILLVCTATAAKFTAEQKTEFEQMTAQLDTPEKVNEWLLENFTYDHEVFNKLVGVKMKKQDFWQYCIKYPIETFFDKKGVCHDAANLAGYILSKADYKVEIVTVRRVTATKSGSLYHTVCAVKRDGKWWVLGDTRGKNGRIRGEIAGPFKNIREVAEYTVDGNLKEYDTVDRRKGF